MLEKVRAALRITTQAYDSELEDLIEAAKLDLNVAGVSNDELAAGNEVNDKLLIRAITTYCKLNFGEPSQINYSAWLASYQEQKAQLSMNRSYTEF